MARQERQILERAVKAVTEQAAKADDLVDEAIALGHGRSDPLVVHAKMLRLELLNVKADLERELEDFSLNCSLRTSPSTAPKCGSMCVGSAVWASRRVIGRIGNPLRMGNRRSSS